MHLEFKFDYSHAVSKNSLYYEHLYLGTPVLSLCRTRIRTTFLKVIFNVGTSTIKVQEVFSTFPNIVSAWSGISVQVHILIGADPGGRGWWLHEVRTPATFGGPSRSTKRGKMLRACMEISLILNLK